ncbi:head-tail adaptor protein [Phaeobacter sp. QD34_3]|uniref:head-tail adaptor protein n=1 Tax=unclassified Phaeobacter TaxID=2621772 RepID=UPI00237F6E02|nr:MULTISPECIES: head-tail adaptor protein [unclassified Phaeobacter]MDE4132104.1 head-tail adaptor protein [Phaeobacter sp. QD34_3]MDE4135742.1 head-tail adaptor protein [Phaeobacter sp. QD34_24]MDE4172643.1 head-tail adaptor protein [Phaeobacter sp. PT47_59]
MTDLAPAPRLNRPLVLEDPQRLPDGAGGYVESWTALGTLWAEVTALSGRNADLEGGSLSLQRYRITVRAAPTGATSRPRPDQRFRDGVRLFRIDAVSEADARGRYLTCFALEEVAA